MFHGYAFLFWCLDLTTVAPCFPGIFFKHKLFFQLGTSLFVSVHWSRLLTNSETAVHGVELCSGGFQSLSSRSVVTVVGTFCQAMVSLFAAYHKEPVVCGVRH